MRSAIGRLAHELPPSAAGALALVGLFVLISALSLVAPQTARERADDVVAPRSSPAPSPAPARSSATPGTARGLFPQPGDPGVLLVTPARPRPTPAPAPVGLGVAPEEGGIIFRIYAGNADQRGVWRYDGATGTVRRLGSSGEPTADGRGYVVRQDDAQYVRVDAATGFVLPIAPLGALSADAGPAGSNVLGAHVEGAAWITLRDGSTRRVADLTASTVRISPDGRRLALMVVVPDPSATNLRRPPTIATELWALDLPDGAPRLVVRLRADGMGPQIQLGPWSPDGTLLTYWEVSISNSINADGVALRAVDVRSGAVHDLGTTLYGASRLSWKAPHTLAFVSGGGRGTWDHKVVRTWSPEAGATDVTTSGVGLNPSWSADGTKLYLISADEHVYDPVQYWAGRNSGDRRLSAYDVATRHLTTFGRLSGYVYEGVRAGRDGTRLLVMWRSTYLARSVNDLPPVEMTLGLFDPATGRTKPLVMTAGDVGFGYYGSYEGPEAMAWSEG